MSIGLFPCRGCGAETVDYAHYKCGKCEDIPSMTDTPGTLEERALAIVKAHYPEMPASYRGRRYQVALAALTEAADEIAALRARVEAVEQLLEGRDAFIVRRGLWDDFVDSTRQALDTPNTFDISRQEARMAAVGLKDSDNS